MQVQRSLITLYYISEIRCTHSSLFSAHSVTKANKQSPHKTIPEEWVDRIADMNFALIEPNYSTGVL